MIVTLDTTEDINGYLCEEMEVFNIKEEKIAMEHCYPLCDSPKDAVIGRSLISCSKVIYFMKLAYNAGKNGEEFVEIEGFLDSVI